MISSLVWKMKRLRAMEPAEVVFRVGQLAHAKIQSLGFDLAKPGPSLPLQSMPWCAENPNIFDVERYRSAADQVLAGKFDVFAMQGTYLGLPPVWNQDPKTKTLSPLKFGKTLNYRDERVVGDIKYLWEPNRHLELVTLAQTWRLTGDSKYERGCQVLLDSWFEQCPYPLGVNWTSSLEHSVRLLNWSFAWQLLGGDASNLFVGPTGLAFKERWLTSVFQHCHFIAGHFSRYSSANNHLLGEYMGLLIGSTIWPKWQECKKWQQDAKQGFESQALLQNGPDGVNKEQAVYYQHEVADMMLLCGLICKANGVEFSVAYWQRLEGMLEFISALMDVSGHVPMLGDSDDALMVRLSQESNWSPYRSLLATGSVIFNRADFAAKAQHFDDKSRWLLGDAAALKFSSLPKPESETPRTAFPDGGYFLMGTRFGQPDEVRATIDCGPLGYLSIAAHGHADALAMVLSAGGRELLIDPGTYAYHTQKKWRDYFRGTLAHNTLRVDAVDQSVIGGNFLWLGKANAQCDFFDATGVIQRFKGQHDGYHRLTDPVTHSREITFDATSNRFTVIDVLKCTEQHAVELCWHFAEDCEVDLSGTVIAIASDKVKMTMSMESATWIPQLFRGEEDLPGGWISRSFDCKSATTTAIWRGQIVGDVRLVTHIVLRFEAESA